MGVQVPLSVPNQTYARVAQLVEALVLETNYVWVRIPPRVPILSRLSIEDGDATPLLDFQTLSRGGMDRTEKKLQIQIKSDKLK